MEGNSALQLSMFFLLQLLLFLLLLLLLLLLYIIIIIIIISYMHFSVYNPFKHLSWSVFA